MLGLSTGIFCLGYCFPVLAPFMLSNKSSAIKNQIAPLAFFILGRFLSYIIFGIIFGLIGYYSKDFRLFHNIIIPFSFIILGTIMILYGFVKSLPHLKLCNIAKRFYSDSQHFFIIGFLVGINLCPPFLLAISYVLSVGKVFESVIFFFFFFLATTVFFLPFLFSGLVSRFEDVRVAARITSVIVGGWFVYFAIARLIA